MANAGGRREKKPPFDKLVQPRDHFLRLMQELDTTARVVGKSRREIAAAVHTSPATLAKYFRGDREMPNSVLVDICNELGMPKALARKIAAAVLPGLVPDETGSWPPRFAPGDIALLESISGPAYFAKNPEGRIMATNKSFKEYFPWMPVPSEGNPVDMPVQLFTNPGARESFGDSWELIAGRSAMWLMIFCPAVVPAERMAEIFDLCRRNPEFEKMMSVMPTEAEFSDIVLSVKCPDGVRREHAVKSLGQDWPDPAAWSLHTMTCLEP
ncbi:hypothetical protein [Nocardia sp. NPDC056100]|uniref:hypothetical protein n=1 Tax=Nocardia sp. NPDC056100 TaxID=3345712 RepID=UPI0035DD4D42